MNEGLIEQRHPILGSLLRAWQQGQTGVGELPGALTPYIVRLHRDGDDWRIAASGGAVNFLYGITLTGLPATTLTPGKDDGASEAGVALESGQPLLLEDDIHLVGGSRRVTRLYLPLSGANPAQQSVLYGVVADD